jgi:tetratricopeptide (TPR) repeat protein
VLAHSLPFARSHTNRTHPFFATSSLYGGQIEAATSLLLHVFEAPSLIAALAKHLQVLPDIELISVLDSLVTYVSFPQRHVLGGAATLPSTPSNSASQAHHLPARVMSCFTQSLAEDLCSQWAQTQFEVMRNLLFLLLAISRLPLQLQLRTRDHLAAVLLPRCAEATRRWHLTSMLCASVLKDPAPLSAQQLDDEQAMQHLSLSDSKRSKRGEESSPQALVNRPLSALLLGDGAAVGMVSLARRALQLLWLCTGHDVVAGRALQRVCERMLQARQFLLLQRCLIQLLAQCKGSGAVAHFFLAQCLFRVGQMDRAAEHFEAAAASPLTEPLLLEVGSSALVGDGMRVPSGPRVEMVDATDAPLGASELVAAADRLELVAAGFWVAVAGQFESARDHHHACEFLEHAVSACSTTHRKAHAVWVSRLFRYRLEAGHYDHAYLAIAENPDRGRQLNSLRRLVVVLCERGHAHLLCSLPLVGFAEEVQRTLLARAQASPVGGVAPTAGANAASHGHGAEHGRRQQPDYYQVLYAFLVSRANYREAASTLYEKATRLALECRGLEALRAQARCLLAAVNAFRLVDAPYRWTVVSGAGLGESSPALPVGGGNDDGRRPRPSSPKRNHQGWERGAETRNRVVELVEIRRQYQLVAARLQLCERSRSRADVDASVVMLAPEDAVPLLLQHGRVDGAVSVAVQHGLRLHTVFEWLANLCLARQGLLPGSGVRVGMSTQTDPFSLAVDAVDEASGDPVTAAWRLLMGMLRRYDSADVNYEYHRLVCDTILRTDSRIHLPTQLTAALTRQYPAALLRAYMKYNLLQSAAHLAVSMVQRAGAQVQGSGRQQCLPFNQLDILLKALAAYQQHDYNESDFTSTLHDHRVQLVNALNHYFECVGV